MYLLTHSHSQSINHLADSKGDNPSRSKSVKQPGGLMKGRETDLKTYKTLKRTNQQPVQVFKNMLRIK